MNKTAPKMYVVTCTPKYPSWNTQTFTVEVYASSKAQANKFARQETINTDAGMVPYTFKAEVKSDE